MFSKVLLSNVEAQNLCLILNYDLVVKQQLSEIKKYRNKQLLWVFWKINQTENVPIS